MSIAASVGFGTYRLSPAIAREMVRHAIIAGIRRIDTAQLYRNQVEVAQAVREAQYGADVHLTTKVARKLIEASPRDNRAIELSVLEVGEWRPNMVLLHCPSNDQEANRIAWHQLNRLEGSWRDLSFGVSNYDVHHLHDIISAGGPCPTVNQVELTPFHHPGALLEYQSRVGIAIEAHSALVKGEKFCSHVLRSIAAAHDGSNPAGVLLAWGVAMGYSLLFSTKSTDRFDENMQLPCLSSDDLALLGGLNCNYRTHPQYTYRGRLLQDESPNNDKFVHHLTLPTLNGQGHDKIIA